VTKTEVIDLAKERLSQVGHGIVFDVIESGVRQDDSWWYVPVLATRNGRDVPREITVGVYSNIEDDLERQHNVNVLFVPVVSEPAAG
jgi:hypothetical protein